MRPTHTLLAIGGYTGQDAPAGTAGGDAPGLTTWWWDGTTGIRAAGAADLPSPSFVCWHPTRPLLYAVSERPQGTVTTLAAAHDGTLRALATSDTGGAHPCWITVDPAGAALLIANYGSGSMAVLALDGDGMPIGEPVVAAHRGSGPVPDRQQGPHVHQVVPTAAGTVLASDLGTDRIVEYRIGTGPSVPASPADRSGSADSSVTVTAVGAIDMPTGSGPRHITLAADGRTGFVTGELDGTVTVIRRRPDPAADAHFGSAPAGGSAWVAAEQVPCSADPAAQPSQLLLAGGDRWLLVANRGPDTLAVLGVGQRLEIRQEIAVGTGPRYFTIEGDRVLLACQQGGVLQVLALQEATGELTVLGDLDPGRSDAAPFAAPSCVAVRSFDVEG